MRFIEKTGHWPGILGADYAGRGGIDSKAPNETAIAYWNQGGLVTISAHLYDPARTNQDWGGLRDKGVDLETLLATNTETHVRWMRELDRVADGLQELKEAGVVVLWRPFHEMNGGWFWWGGHDPETFIRLWREMFDYFSDAKGLDNLLWVYAPNHGNRTAAYYPGDRYVDLVGLDAYTDFVDTNHIQGYAQVARSEQALRLYGIRPARSRESAGGLRLPSIHPGHPARFSTDRFFHELERPVEPGAKHQHDGIVESSLDRQSGRPAQRHRRKTVGAVACPAPAAAGGNRRSATPWSRSASQTCCHED